MMRVTEIEGTDRAFCIRVDAPGWHMIAESADGQAYRDNSGMSVIISGELHESKKWAHLSFARKTRLPSYADMIRVKHVFLGDDKKALMVLPGIDEWVNIHPFCLHLYHCLDNDGLPDFRGFIGGRGTI